nr:hypothetical transcript [Hymenolepis microstoma]
MTIPSLFFPDAEVDLRKVVAVIILIPLFAVLVFLILFALRNTIPALQPLFNRRKPRVDIVLAPMTAVSYSDENSLDQEPQFNFHVFPPDLSSTSNHVNQFPMRTL